MRYLFDAWQEFSADCLAARHVLLLTDYDGTLTPIVDRPENAVLPPPVREILTSLARKKNFSVGVISGRSIEETKRLVNVKDIYYSGNHGLEIDGPGLKYRNPSAFSARTLISDLAAKLSAELSGIKGVIVQDKGFTLSVHYRLVKPGDEKAVTGIVKRLAAPFLERGEIRVFKQKKVWEIRPPLDWDKGKAVMLIGQEIGNKLHLPALLTVYLGDDTTDEDVFRVLQRPEGWSIYVGEENKKSAAEYYLKSTEEVEAFLRRTAGIR